VTAPALYWVGIVGGFAGVAAYFLALAIRPHWIRVLNGSALFFTGLGLMQLAITLRGAGLGPGWYNANVAVIALTVAVAVQSYAVLRNRAAWDGVDRRGETAD
jgi:uncharacterized membrane protein